VVWLREWSVALHVTKCEVNKSLLHVNVRRLQYYSTSSNGTTCCLCQWTLLGVVSKGGSGRSTAPTIIMRVSVLFAFASMLCGLWVTTPPLQFFSNMYTYVTHNVTLSHAMWNQQCAKSVADAYRSEHHDCVPVFGILMQKCISARSKIYLSSNSKIADESFGLSRWGSFGILMWVGNVA
jgi:hypothetical protein